MQIRSCLKRSSRTEANKDRLGSVFKLRLNSNKGTKSDTKTLLRLVAAPCDEIGANLVIAPARTGNSGIKTALVDGFIFGNLVPKPDLTR
jgi:hypothetical protein